MFGYFDCSGWTTYVIHILLMLDPGWKTYVIHPGIFFMLDPKGNIVGMIRQRTAF